MRISFYESVKNLHHGLWRPEQFASPLRERLKNAHHGFMKALKMCISFLWVFQKFASRLMTVIRKYPFVWALQQCASRFYEGLKNVHLLFMSLSKMCIAIYEGHKISNLLSMSAATVRITILWRPEQGASPFYESFKNVNQNLWRSFKTIDQLYTGNNDAHERCTYCCPQNKKHMGEAH